MRGDDAAGLTFLPLDRREVVVKARVEVRVRRLAVRPAPLRDSGILDAMVVVVMV